MRANDDIIRKELDTKPNRTTPHHTISFYSYLYITASAICTHEYTRARPAVLQYIYACMCSHVYLCVCVRVHVRVPASIYIQIHIHIHACVCVHLLFGDTQSHGGQLFVL